MRGLLLCVAQQLLQSCFLLRLPVSTILMQVPVLTGTCASTFEELCMSKKRKSITNALEREKHSRFLSTSCDWMEGVFFLHTFIHRENMVEA